MKLNIDQKIVGHVSESVINNLLNAIDEPDWYADDYRESAGNMQDTNSIPIIHSHLCGADSTIKTIQTIEKRVLYDKFYPLIEPIFNELSKTYSFNKIACFLSRLKPRGTIGVHADSGIFLELCHRIHVPLKSNPRVRYVINGVSYFWEPGKIYEFNNLLPHGVFNESPEERIHLVVNLYNLTQEQMDKYQLSEIV
jgi:hypothetical protein